MLNALKYKDEILELFYLDDDDNIIRNKIDRHGRKKDSIVKPFNLVGNGNRNYKGIWLPKGGTSITLPWIYIVLRELDFYDTSVIDHINGDYTDNRRVNLRVTTQQMNCRNRIKHKNNTSGYTGLSYHKPTGRWVVRRTIEGKRIWKSHLTKDGAIEIWKQIDELSKRDHGYTDRHGKDRGSETIESTSI